MEVKITETAKKTAGLLRTTAEVLQGVRSVAVELNAGAAAAPAKDLAPMIAEGISERIDAVRAISEAAQEAAESAKAVADDAKSVADSAGVAATAASITANAAKTTADNVQDAADNARSAADKAQATADKAQSTADKAQDAADGNTALLGAITASAVWPKPNDTAPLRIVATQDKLQAVVSRGELVWAAEDADVIKFVRAEGGSGTATVALNTTDKNYSLTLGAGEGKAVLPATITDITTSADNDIEHVRLRGKLNKSGIQFNQKFPNLKTADLAGLDMSGLTSLLQLFRDCGGATVIDVSGWDTSGMTSLAQVFYDCQNLISLDVSSWDTSGVTNMDSLFYNCRVLTTLDLSSFDTSKVVNMNYFFNNLRALTTLKFDTLDMGSVTSATAIFRNNNALTTVTGTITGLKVSLDLNSCPLTNASAMVFINGLAEVSTAQTITFKATTYATLTEEQLAIATSKGWTVTSA